MTSVFTNAKKPALCRYFVSKGSCSFGEECQYLHQSPVGFAAHNFSNQFPNGSLSKTSPINLLESLGMPVQEGTTTNGDPFFNTTFSGAETSATSQSEFQPFSRPGPISRQPRGSVVMSGNGVLTSNSPMSNSSMSQPPPLSSPFSVSSMTPNKVPISHSTPLSQHQTSHPPPQNGPVSSMMNGQLAPNMKHYLNNSYDSNLTNDFSALNLSVPNSSKGGNPMGSEFIPKMPGGLSHSTSSPNFSNFNAAAPPPLGTLPVNTTASAHLAGLNITASSSPNHSPRLSPTNSPLMMRRTGSPVAPLRTKLPPGSTIQENVGGTTYFYNAEDFTPQREGIQLPNFTMYQGPPPHVSHMKVKSNMPGFFMPDELKMEVLNRSAITMAQIDLAQNIDIPPEVDTYRNLFPLEATPDNPHHKSKTFGYPTTCYKALNTKDGQTYCLRRIHGFRLVHTKCMTIVDMWKKMYHPNIVQLREVFTTKAFSDHSIVFVYDYYPMAETLLSKHQQMNGVHNPFNMDPSVRPFSSKGKGSSAPRQHAGLLPESLIWSYVVQLSSALRAIHAAGLSCRTLDPSKILIYGKSRLRLNCCGIFDVLTFDNNQSNPMALTPHYQQEDLISLGKVVLALACNSVMAIQRDNMQASMELVARNYSADLKNLILYLLGNQNRPRSINDIMPMIGARFYTQLDSAQLRSDVLETELAKEVENGRLFRLLCKMGTINERPEFFLDPQWSDTGDRYMLKLFRDYVFHQVDENGAPWVDMSHIVMCLNKLDAGSPEKISLVSRDEQNILVVSYSELKQCFENAFRDVLNPSSQGGL